MADCDIRSYTMSFNATFRFVYDFVGAVGSVLLLVVMRKTSTLKGFSGLLLFNEQIACLLEQLLSIALNVILPFSHSLINTTLLSCIQTAKNVSLLLLLAINTTLYTAICRGLAFKKIWTWRRIIATIVLCWITSIPLGMAPMYSNGYFEFDCDSMYPFPSEDAYWRLVIYVTFSCLALLANSLLLYKIVHRRAVVQPSRNLRALTETNKKVKLAIFVFVIYILYAITYIGMYTVWYTKTSMAHVGINVGIAFNIVVYLHKSFMNLRLFFFLPLYKPLLATVKSTFACQTGREIGTVDITLPRPSVNTRTFKKGEKPTALNPMTYETRDACNTYGKVVDAVSIQPAFSSTSSVHHSVQVRDEKATRGQDVKRHGKKGELSTQCDAESSEIETLRWHRD